MLIVKEWVQGDSYKVHVLYLSRGEGMVFLETRAAFLTAAIVWSIGWQAPDGGVESLTRVVWRSSSVYFLLITYRKAQGLKFGGEGEGCGLALTMFLLRGPSWPHSPTHSTIQYIVIHPSPCALLPPKYHICSMKKDLLKTLEVMHDFIYKLWFYQMNSYDGDGRKTPKYIQKQRNKGKIPRLVALPSPRL